MSRDEGKGSQQSLPDEHLRRLNKEYESNQHTEKSLNRSQSYQTIPKDLITDSIDNLNHYSGNDEDQSNGGGKMVYPEQIEIQLEDALRYEQQKLSPEQNDNSIEALRDPRFFMRQVDEVDHLEHTKMHNSTNISEEKHKDQSSIMNEATTMDGDRPFGNSSFMESSTSPQTNQKLIKVENQQFEDP